MEVLHEGNLKFLIIRFSSIGDIVLTTPVVRCLKKKFPSAVIHFLTKASFAGILYSNPYVDEVIVLDENIKETIARINSEQYYRIIDLQHNLRSLQIKQQVKGTPFLLFNKLNIEKWLLTAVKINILPDIHIVDRYLKTAEPLGVKNDGEGLDFFIPENERIKPEDIPFSHSQGYIALVIGAAHNTKKLPVEKLISLTGKISYPMILIGGPGDVGEGEEIAATDKVKIYNACGKFSLNESADIIRKASLVITHDTGMMHIAAAFKKHILSVWGNTVPSFGMTPYLTTFEVFQVNKLWCRPCTKTGFEKCPLGHFKCMQKQDMNALANRVKAILNIEG